MIIVIKLVFSSASFPKLKKVTQKEHPHHPGGYFPTSPAPSQPVAGTGNTLASTLIHGNPPESLEAFGEGLKTSSLFLL